LIKRRTLANILAVIFLGLFIYYAYGYLYPEDPYASYQIDTSIKWSEFIRECGKAVPLEAARKVYQNKYYKKHVQWEGHVMRVDGNELNYAH
jgi:hypothetical protein